MSVKYSLALLVSMCLIVATFAQTSNTTKTDALFADESGYQNEDVEMDSDQERDARALVLKLDEEDEIDPDTLIKAPGSTDNFRSSTGESPCLRSGRFVRQCESRGWKPICLIRTTRSGNRKAHWYCRDGRAWNV